MIPSQHEANQATLYGWLTEEILPMLKSGGLWAAPDPAPLSTQEVVEVFETVAKHDNYRNHTLMSMTEDGKTVKLERGKISIS